MAELRNSVSVTSNNRLDTSIFDQFQVYEVSRIQAPNSGSSDSLALPYLKSMASLHRTTVYLEGRIGKAYDVIVETRVSLNTT